SERIGRCPAPEATLRVELPVIKAQVLGQPRAAGQQREAPLARQKTYPVLGAGDEAATPGRGGPQVGRHRETLQAGRIRVARMELPFKNINPVETISVPEGPLTYRAFRSAEELGVDR